MQKSFVVALVATSAIAVKTKNRQDQGDLNDLEYLRLREETWGDAYRKRTTQIPQVDVPGLPDVPSSADPIEDFDKVYKPIMESQSMAALNAAWRNEEAKRPALLQVCAAGEDCRNQNERDVQEDVEQVW